MRFFESVDKHKPHLAAVIADGAPAGPELRRSELFCAVTLIMRSMTVDKHHEHMINPVRWAFLSMSLMVVNADVLFS